MDGDRFDRFARGMAFRVGRRAVVLGLAAALFGWRQQSGAQPDPLPLGGACADSGECGANYDEVQHICADNGVAEDGPLNCCVAAALGGCCGADGHCCGDLLCVPAAVGRQPCTWWCDVDPGLAAFGTRTALDALNLRSDPDLGARVELVLPAGAVVSVRGEVVNGFLPVEYQGMLGWASTAYLTQQGSADWSATASM